MDWLPLDVIRQFLHVISASIWVGGQLVMIALLPTVRSHGTEVSKAAGRAYNRLAWPAFGFLVLTGIWNILERSFSGDGVIVISLKLTLVFFSGLGAASHQWASSRMSPDAKGRTFLLASGATISTLFAIAAMYLGLLLMRV